MPWHILIRLLGGLAVLSAGAGQVAAQGITWTKIARTGEYAPGMPGCIVSPQPHVAPQIDNAGNVLFRAAFSCDDGASGVGLLYGATESLSVLQQIGQAPPGLNPNSTISGWLPRLSEGGDIVTVTKLGIVGVNSLYAGNVTSGLSLVAGIGQPAPGIPGGTTISISDVHPRINATGAIAFAQGVSNLSADPAQFGVLTSGPPASLSTAVQFLGPAPGIPGAILLGGTSGLTYSDLGWLGFSSFLQGRGIDPTNHFALFAGPTNDLHVIARQGDQAPGVRVGVSFLNFSNAPAQNGDGDVLFFGLVQGEGIGEANDLGLWGGPRDSPTLVVRESDPAPGLPAGTAIAELASAYLSDAHQVAFRARLMGGGITASSDDAYWRGPLGSPDLLVREGDAAGGLASGVQFVFSESYPRLIFNDEAELLMLAFISGPGVNSGNDFGLWAYDDQADAWQIILRTGDAFDGRVISSGPSAILISDISSSSGFGQTFNDASEFVVRVEFTDGGTGLYRFTVPEPASIGIVICSTAAICCRRSRGTRMNRRIPC